MVDPDSHKLDLTDKQREFLKRMIDRTEHRRENFPTSILTHAQREYLRGERDISGKQERDMRSRIRRRINAAFYDFPLILNELPLEDIMDSFHGGEGIDSKKNPQQHTYFHMRAAIALIFLANYQQVERTRDANQKITILQGVRSEWYDPEEVGIRKQMAIEVEEGIRRAINRLELLCDVDVAIDITLGPELDELAERDLTELSLPALGQLHEAGKISWEEFLETCAEIERMENKE